MGWSISYDDRWYRDIGYGVPAECDHPDCRKRIHRGLAYVCGGEPFGGEEGCGLHFCGKHLFVGVTGKTQQVCGRCAHNRKPFKPKPDLRTWVRHKLNDPSWREWREANPDEVAEMRKAIEGR